MTDNSLLWQYIFVFLILIGTIAWILYRLFSKKQKGKSCCGCSLADTCAANSKGHPIKRNERRNSMEAEAAVKKCCKNK